MADPNPGLDGAGEGAEDLELEPMVIPAEPGGDPLDDIKDPKARDEAKAHRAIARRQKEKPDEPAPVVTPPSTEFLTKADFFKSNEKLAVRQAIADAEIKAHWNEIVPFYSPRRGKETVEDISEDIKDAIVLFKVRNPDVITDDSARDLTVSPVVKSGGVTTVDKTTPKKLPDPPGFRLPTSPKDWYPKKDTA